MSEHILMPFFSLVDESGRGSITISISSKTKSSDLYLEDYPFRRLMTRLNEIRFTGFCLAEIPPSTDPVRLMKYYRALWLAYQNLL